MLMKLRAQQRFVCDRIRLQQIYQHYVTLKGQEKTSACPVSAQKSNVEITPEEWQHAKPYQQIPGLTRFQLISKFLPGGEFYSQTFDKVLSTCHERFGDIFVYPGLLGRADLVMLFKVEDFEKVHRTEGVSPLRPAGYAAKYYRANRADKFFEEWPGLNADGEQWSKFRSVVNPIVMQPKNAQLYLDPMQALNDQFIQRIRAIRDPATNEVPDDFLDTINRLTLETVSAVALDKEFGLLRDGPQSEDAIRFLKSVSFFPKSFYELDIRPSLFEHIKTPTYKAFEHAMDTVFEVSSKYINEALARIESQHMGHAKELSVVGKLAKINKKIAIVMAMDMLMAGVDASSSAMASLILNIAKNPEKQQKLREELLSALPQKGDRFTAENMRNLSYLRACIKESLRVSPIVFGNMRKTGMDLVLAGYQIPKGTSVLLNSHVFMVQDRYFPRAKEFLPERWLRLSSQEGNAEKLMADKMNPFIYLPFGFGPRHCAGRRIVDLELEITLANLVRNFNIEFNYPTEDLFRTFFISTPVKPLKFKFTDLK